MRAEDLLIHGLPFNRKERFFTGTVFPALVCGQEFAELGRLLARLDFGGVEPSWTDVEANTQVVTEYGIAESLIGNADPRFADCLPARDTPDVVIYQPGHLLLGIEAKMFDRAPAAALNAQVARQHEVLLPLGLALGLAVDQVRHLLLLPEALAAQPGLAYPTLTWEELLEMYEDGPRWATDVLAHALQHWTHFAGSSKGAGAQAYLTGAEIQAGHLAGGLDPAVIGRNKGSDGQLFSEDVRTGRWRDWRYQVRYEAQPPNSNWFTVEQFVHAVSDVPSAQDVHLTSWLLARDAVRQHGPAVLVREIHPGGGQSDVLCISAIEAVALQDAPMVWLNRQGGIHARNPDRVIATWSEAGTAIGRSHVLAAVAAFATPVEVETSAAVLLDCVTAVMDLSARGLLPEIRLVSAALDTSGYGPDSGWREDLLRPFPNATDILNRQARLLDGEDWQWWVLTDANARQPLALVHLSGKVWLPRHETLAADLPDAGTSGVVRALVEATCSLDRSPRS